MHIEMIKPVDMTITWAQIENVLWEAVAYGNRTEYMRGLQSRLWGGMDQLWKLQNGEELGYAVTTFYSPNPHTHVAQIYLLSSSAFNYLETYLNEFEAFATKNGANVIEVLGRKAWERKLKPYGFYHEYTAVRKTITRGLN